MWHEMAGIWSQVSFDQCHKFTLAEKQCRQENPTGVDCGLKRLAIGRGWVFDFNIRTGGSYIEFERE
jgi:hypothetical protein